MKLAFTIHWYGECAIIPETYISDDFLPAEVRGQIAGNNHNAEMTLSIVKEAGK